MGKLNVPKPLLRFMHGAKMDVVQSPSPVASVRGTELWQGTGTETDACTINERGLILGLS